MFLPLWFYLGIVMNISGWIVSWSHTAPWSSMMFIFIWGGFILILDGINYRLKGSSLLSRSPRSFVFVCLLSSLFWWYFEIVNMLTSNWYYLIDIQLSPLAYQLMASLYFMTVIPVVFELAELIHFRKILGDTIHWIRISEHTWIIMLTIGLLALILPFIRPDFFYPLIWLAPGLIFEAINHKLGYDSLLDDLIRGDWTRVVTLALSALIIGSLWELWNLYADPKWVYAIPYVGFAKIFEMPVIGFLGYIPFGWSIFSFYAFAQGTLRFPQRKFFVESEYSFKPRIHVDAIITVLFVVIIAFSLLLAFTDTTINSYFTAQTPIPFQTSPALVSSAENTYSGQVTICHIGLLEGRCLAVSVGQTYLLVDANGHTVKFPSLGPVRVTGSVQPQMLGLDQLTVDHVERQ